MYEKPQILDAAYSIKAIQGSTDGIKNVAQYADGLPPFAHNATSSAYEADE